MSLAQHLVDRRVKYRHVALDVQTSVSRRSPERIAPSSPGRIGLDKLYFLREVGVASLEAAGEGGIEVGDRLEPFDPAHWLSRLDARAGLDLEVHFHRLA